MTKHRINARTDANESLFEFVELIGNCELHDYQKKLINCINKGFRVEMVGYNEQKRLQKDYLYKMQKKFNEYAKEFYEQNKD